MYFSCSSVHPAGTDLKSFSGRYSLDKLPEQWKKPATLKAINDILPVAIKQLKNARSCMNCKADFWVTVQLDSLFILNQTTVDKTAWDSKSAISGQQPSFSKNEITCTFRFKSHLSILDSMGIELVHLVIVDPKEDIYSITGNPWENGRRSSLLNSGAGYKRPFGTLVPTDNELLDFTKGKLKVIQKRIQKLVNNNSQEY